MLPALARDRCVKSAAMREPHGTQLGDETDLLTFPDSELPDALAYRPK